MNMLDRSRGAGRGIWTTVSMLVVVLLTIGAAGLSRASTAQTVGPYKLYLPLVANGPDGADIAVTIRPNPSIRVTKGTRLEYVIAVRNYGAGAADEVRVTLPYDNTKLTLRDGRFDTDKGDFVSNVTSSEVTVTFGRVAPGEERGGSLYFLVNAALADDTVIDMRGTARFDDARGGGERTTNFAPVIVGSFDNSSPYVFMAVEPVLGPKGTTFRFFSDRFLPGERINAVLEFRGQRFNVDVNLRADALGRITLDYGSTDLQPGAYTMFFFGERSKLAGAREFFVDPSP